MNRTIFMADGKISVLYLSPYFWPEKIGSAPYCCEVAEYLAEKGYAVSVVSFRPHYPSVDPFAEWADGARDRERLGEIEIERVPADPRGSGGFMPRVRNDVRFLSRAISGALSGRYRGADVIVAYTPSVLTLYGAMALKIRSGAPVVAVVHDVESGLAKALNISRKRFMLAVMRLVERIGFSLADDIIVLSDGMKKEIQRIGCRRPIEVLPIWSQTSDDVPIDRDGPVRLMYSGNFGKKQNLDQLLPLISFLGKEMPDVEIIMRGDGSERARIEAEIAARGLTNTRFLDLAPAEAFMASLQGANAHLVPQALNVANYALPSKLFSIMSAGRPFVCIAEPGSPLDRLARDSGAGICIEPQDETRLCAEVAALLKAADRQDRMGRNGRDFVLRHMNRNDILARYEAIIRNAYSHRPQVQLS